MTGLLLMEALTRSRDLGVHTHSLDGSVRLMTSNESNVVPCDE